MPPRIFRCSTAFSVVLGLPLDYPAKEVQGRGVCYSQDTAEDRMAIDEETRQALRDGLTVLGLIRGSGSGDGN